MDLKRFSQESRKRLMSGVARRLLYWGFDAEGNCTESVTKVPGGYQFRGAVHDDPGVPALWDALKVAIGRKGVEVIVEEAAYTWFNRMMAMQILSKQGFEEPQLDFAGGDSLVPQILKRAQQGHAPFLAPEEKTRLDVLVGSFTRDQEALALLISGFCHHHKTLSRVFGKPDDYTELLLPDDMLKETGFLHLLNTTDALTDEEYQKVELIGWLYQFYISERKDEVFAAFGKGKKAEAKDIPAATQIFTPNWIVKYMVENTAGKAWLDRFPDSSLKGEMQYLVENESDGPRAPIIGDVEELTLIDPACGSGHILVEGFDLLYKMYLERYYSPEEAVDSILKRNLFGLDIDDRAAQLATFAVLLKAAKYDRDVWSRGVLPQVFAMPEAKPFNPQETKDFLGPDGAQYASSLQVALNRMQDAKNLGSVMKLELSPEAQEFIALRYKALQSFDSRNFNEETVLRDISPFIPPLLALTRKYTAVVANPPYMGQKNMNAELKAYVNKHYPISKTDLFTVFMEVNAELTEGYGRYSIINLPSWLFLSSFERLREKILKKQTIESLLHMGRGIFGIDFGSVAFAIRKEKSHSSTGAYFKLHERNFQHIYSWDIAQLFLLSKKNIRYRYDFTGYRDSEGVTNIPHEGDPKGVQLAFRDIPQSNFSKIPGSPLVFWVDESVFNAFSQFPSLGEVSKGKVGMQTAKNDYFLRRWYEISKNDFGQGNKTWIPYLKGGEFRKWYGNQDFVLRYYGDGQLLKQQKNATCLSEEILGRAKCTWSDVAAGDFHCRLAPRWSFYDIKGHCFFPEEASQYSLLAWVNSSVFNYLMKFMNPTLSYQVGDFNKIPIPERVINDPVLSNLAMENVQIVREDWDSREASVEFQGSPINLSLSSISEGYACWAENAVKTFFRLRENEEEINSLCLMHFGDSDNIPKRVSLNKISVLKQEVVVSEINGEVKVNIDHSEVMRQLLSYFVGILMGRYRLDRPGLNIAHPDPTADELSGYFHNGHQIEIDEDAILPIMGSECQFPDDVLHRFHGLLDAIWGAETRTVNLNFLQECLGKDVEKYLVKDFFKDHCGRYKKKPIYWLFASKKGAFQVLVYMHRMNAFTVEKIRSNYLLEHLKHLMQEEQRLAANELNLSTRDAKRLDKLRKDIAECEAYDLDLKDVADRQIAFDLDDGVTANHKLFGSVVAPIK